MPRGGLNAKQWLQFTVKVPEQVFPQLQYAPLAVGWAQAYVSLDVWSLLFTDRSFPLRATRVRAPRPVLSDLFADRQIWCGARRRFWDCLLSQTTVGTVWGTRTKLFVWSLAPICFVLLQLLPCLIVMCISGVASQRFRNSAGAAGTGVLFLVFISYPSIPRALISLGLDCATLANGTAVRLSCPPHAAQPCRDLISRRPVGSIPRT